MSHFDVMELFPTPLIIMQIEEDTDELFEVKDFSESVCSNYGPDKVRNDVRGKRILENYPHLRDMFLEKFNKVMEKYMAFKKKDYMITTSWITYMEKGGRSDRHCHRNCFWSGIYYFQNEYPEGTAKLKFHGPQNLGDYFFGLHEFEELTISNSTAWTYKPLPKTLYLFPSHLEHEIKTHEIDTIRQSLAFNIAPASRYGSFDSSYDQSWINN